MSKSHNVVLVPSLGRPASDFARLERDLAGAGFMPVSVEPFPEWEGGPTLHDLAGAVVANLEEQGVTQFHLIGHAFGNRLSRCITASHRTCIW
jgi:pimeloyl-ACP methyl ester carboxylesterase